MARTIIDIPDAQLREVDSLCRQLGLSRAEAVRRALREYLQHSDSARTEGFGLWMGHSTEVDEVGGLPNGAKDQKSLSPLSPTSRAAPRMPPRTR